MKRVLIVRAAAPETCCEIIPLTRLWKGSASSAKPSAENIPQWWDSISHFRLGSTERRCAVAWPRIVFVVAGACCLMGRTAVLFARGAINGALVPCGDAGLSFATPATGSCVDFLVETGFLPPAEDDLVRFVTPALEALSTFAMAPFVFERVVATIGTDIFIRLGKSGDDG